MITGIVYNQWSNGVDRCFATGIVELYEDEGLTTLISSSPMALGVYTLPNIPNYSNRIVYLVVRNSLGDVVYQNQFTFYSDPYGNQIDYTDLNIFVNDTSAITCNPNYLQDAIVCSFYLIRKPSAPAFRQTISRAAPGLLPSAPSMTSLDSSALLTRRLRNDIICSPKSSGCTSYSVTSPFFSSPTRVAAPREISSRLSLPCTTSTRSAPRRCMTRT